MAKDKIHELENQLASLEEYNKQVTLRYERDIYDTNKSISEMEEERELMGGNPKIVAILDSKYSNLKELERELVEEFEKLTYKISNYRNELESQIKELKKSEEKEAD